MHLYKLRIIKDIDRRNVESLGLGSMIECHPSWNISPK